MPAAASAIVSDAANRPDRDRSRTDSPVGQGSRGVHDRRLGVRAGRASEEGIRGSSPTPWSGSSRPTRAPGSATCGCPWARPTTRRPTATTPTPTSRPTDLSTFSIEHDKQYIIPMLKEAIRINPEIELMGSPWSPPAWMKTNELAASGSPSRRRPRARPIGSSPSASISTPSISSSTSRPTASKASRSTRSRCRTSRNSTPPATRACG